jgi:(1->4)-alpha-D-glucan 1-alpha-D-glucosylmutase
MSDFDDVVRRLAGLVGIADTFTDVFGRAIETPTETRRAILSAFGLAADTAAEARDSLERVQRLREGPIPPLLVVEAEAPGTLPLRAPADAVRWTLTDERGTEREGRGTRLPPLPAGYYDLRLTTGSGPAKATVIAAPAACYEPEPLAGGARAWGATVQVYGLRSREDLGIGDYADVRRAVEGAARLGASFLGLSPVHAMFSADRTKVSPYSPSSRLFLETIFIDPTEVEGFEGSAAARLLDGADVQQRLAGLRTAALIDHAAVWDVKRPLLEALWTDFRERGRYGRFEAFRRQLGEPLEAHATFEALSEHFRKEERWWLGDWPEPFRAGGAEQVVRFAAEHRERVDFHAWLQWIADRQLEAAARRARADGMQIGLYRDLAVGADAGGSEIWAAPERFAPALSVGAPPDLLGPAGQKWGLPPFNPLTLETQGLAAFRALVVANMRHAGAIRIDHAFQLQRLFLIPEHAPAAQGAYVAYPFEAMLAVLRIESHRARALVIAEDLGTSPEGFSDAIMGSGVLSYRVLSFERGEGGTFKPPGAYPRSALAVITTHDLPTFRGWWRGLDIDLRQTLALFDVESSERERLNRVEERRRLAEALHAEGLLASPEPPEEPPLEAVIRYLARTPSVLAGLQIEDAAGELNQANLPGVDAQHPNWRRRLSSDIDQITAPGGEFAKLATAFATEGRGLVPNPSPLASPPPRATYRVQFHKDFTFDDAVAIVPYLAKLGVSHVYASPIHKARPGSTHGYDIVDHTAINPELGGEEGFERLSEALKQHGLGLVLDIVPNHMGVGGADNGWWLSMLEWGELSPEAKAFDVDWERLGANGKLVVPFLGDRYGDALEKGNLKLAFDAAEGSFSVWHYEHRFPISPLSYPIVLDRALVAVGEIGTEAAAAVLAASERLRIMGEKTVAERRAAFPEEGAALKRRIAAAAAGSPGLRVAIERAVGLINGTSGLPESFGTLHRILESQAYRLAHWRVAASDINYRRFFDINSLAGMRVEDPEVFARTHEMVFRLVREGRVQGLRIDHVDGLADPAGYVRALQGAVGPGFYIVVEKILEHGETLRPWPIAGTTGYDTLNVIDGVFVDTEAGDAIERLYRRTTEVEGSYGALLRRAKTETLEASFASELEVLVSDLKRIADADRRTRDYTVYAMRRALTEIVARFPVYRSYLTDEEPSPEDVRLIERTVERAKRSSALPDRTVHDFAADALLGRIETEGPGRPAPDHLRRFRRRFQQLTGPVMAKSLEDTLFYRYVRLISLNEVGGDPGHFGLALDGFHDANAARVATWPYAMIASATHDTKRGEDARGRLNALSEMPGEWAQALDRWRTIAEPHLAEGEELAAAPDANDESMMLQAILGAWPMELLDEGVGYEAVVGFRERLEGFLTKALREAKRHTSWVNVDEAYEAAAQALLRALVAPEAAFLDAFRPLARRLAFHGMLNGLARTVLKCTLPGVPDVYQGTEFWDLSLVDPDNRRPVDYGARARALEAEEPVDALLGSWRDGRIKQRIVHRLLTDRAEAPSLYAEGGYEPLPASGAAANRVVAFTRTYGRDTLVVAVPRLLGGAVADETMPVGREFWGDAALPLPPGRWRDVVTGASLETGEGPHPIGELFSILPISVLRTSR